MKSQEESQIAPEKSIGKKPGSNIPGLPYDSEIIQKSIELNLMPSERLLLLRLRAYMFDKNTKKKRRRQAWCWPSQAKLAREIGISRRQVITLIQKLAEMNMIEVTTRNPNGKGLGNHHNEYRIIYPWKPTQTGPVKSELTSHLTDFKSEVCDTSKVKFATSKSEVCDILKVKSVHTNKRGNKIENKSSSLKKKIDEEDPHLNFSKKSAAEGKQKNESEKISDFDKRKSEADKWVSKLSPDKIEKLKDFLEMKVNWHKPGDPSAYKLAIIENIIAGKQPDFERHEGPRFKFRLLDGAKWDDE